MGAVSGVLSYNVNELAGTFDEAHYNVIYTDKYYILLIEQKIHLIVDLNPCLNGEVECDSYFYNRNPVP